MAKLIDELEMRAHRVCESCDGIDSGLFRCPECDGTRVPLWQTFNTNDIQGLIELAQIHFRIQAGEHESGDHVKQIELYTQFHEEIK